MKSIVLAADNNYLEQLLTTIKSICYHNKNIQFYLFNRQISEEWFTGLNRYLNKINCEVIDVKISTNNLLNYKTLPHISSETTYYRYFIADVIKSDKVLYLDSDLVVNGNLDVLFDIELDDDIFIAATLDDLAKNNHNLENFNAGVLLINNRLWKVQEISRKAIELSNLYTNQVSDGDQSILNLLFGNKWLKLNPLLNYLVGAEYIYLREGKRELICRNQDELPFILHFNTAYKPWLPFYDLPFRAYYWFYNHLDWNDIIAQHK